MTTLIVSIFSALVVAAAVNAVVVSNDNTFESIDIVDFKAA